MTNLRNYIFAPGLLHLVSFSLDHLFPGLTQLQNTCKNKLLCALLDQSQERDICFLLWNNCFNFIPIPERKYTILLWSSFEHDFVFAFNAKSVKGAYIKQYLRIHTSLLFNPKIKRKKKLLSWEETTSMSKMNKTKTRQHCRLTLWKYDSWKRRNTHHHITKECQNKRSK